MRLSEAQELLLICCIRRACPTPVFASCVTTISCIRSRQNNVAAQSVFTITWCPEYSYRHTIYSGIRPVSEYSGGVTCALVCRGHSLSCEALWPHTRCRTERFLHVSDGSYGKQFYRKGQSFELNFFVNSRCRKHGVTAASFNNCCALANRIARKRYTGLAFVIMTRWKTYDSLKFKYC